MKLTTRTASTVLAGIVAAPVAAVVLAQGASAATVNNSACNVEGLSFQHQAGVGYRARIDFDCASVQGVQILVKQNGAVIQTWNGTKTGIHDWLPYFSAARGAGYQIVLSYSSAGYATSGAPQVLAN